jgi:xanthine dehydrogenase accessory factor
VLTAWRAAPEVEPGLRPDLDWPMFGLTEDVRPALRALRDHGRPAVLATLYRVDGGGPRPPGTQMVLGEGVAAGFFSGGCVEGDIACHADEVMRAGAPRRLVYGEGSRYPDIRLLCSARIEILLERVAPDDPALARLLELTRARRPALWLTDGAGRLCLEQDEPLPAPFLTPGSEGVGLSEAPFALVRRCDPVQRVVVIGGDPTALAVAALADQVGMETVLVRPNGPPSPPPLQGVAYHRGSPQAVFAQLGLDRWTAVAVATHEIEADEPALAAALTSPAGYVGVLGARRRIPERLARLSAIGVSAEALRRLKAPIGLPLGAKAPWAVAVAVIGEILQQQAMASEDADA